ncbi:hypothetical protein CPB84DRAFT_1805593 [Gymnopilus junonius]|uniref:Uncharacterized protein n=1 Tax=Gymnopilus junonius TaxID=109634 RepID=A0A9P5N7W6_GYMJU|nr:hypothetical protein CPB84DRAFT_1805593 [Gymnopilus junonius]
MTPLFSAPSSPLDISHLRSLKLEGIWSVSDINGMLNLCSNTLKELDFFPSLRVPSQRPFVVQTLDFGILLNLNCLIIHTGIHSFRSTSPRENRNLFRIASALRTLPFNTFHPMQLRLTLKVLFHYLKSFQIGVSSLPDWSDFTSVLDDNRMYFANVKIEFQCPKFDRQLGLLDTFRPHLVDIMDKNEVLTKFREEGVLSYEYF